VVGIDRETTSVSAKTLITATEAASISASITIEASIAAEAATNTVVGLIVGAVVPLNALGVLGHELLEELRNLLLGLDQDLAEVFTEIFVAVVEERGSLACVADTRGATDAVDVLGDAVVLSRGQIVVDDVLDVGNIETTSSNTGSDQDGAATSTEGAPIPVSRGL
jgi:hypothetical protein